MNDATLPAMPVPSDSLWSRLRTTPLGNTLRGELTGSLDVRRVIAAANLPKPLPDLIYLTVCRARLWRTERLNVTHELINRFRANLDAGRAPEDVIKAFGDPIRAAQMIRREKLFRPAVARVELPQPLQELVYEVARRTRLWRSERVDVARELANHFGDGTDAGRTPEQLIKSFGDPRKAARLIRRAKLRNRPFVWRAWRRAWQAAGLLILLVLLTYIVLLIRLKTAHPTISRNYGLEMNAPARAVPENDRAWPLYREALLHLTAEPHIVWSSDEKPPADALNFSVLNEKPDGKHWGMVTAWLAENKVALDLIRQAASRPRLGFVSGDPADRPWLKKMDIDPKFMDFNKNRFLYALIHPELQEARSLLNLILADAHRAMAESDRAMFIRDLEAAFALAELIRDDVPFIITDLVSFSLFGQTLATIDRTLAEHSGFLTEVDLKRLAHCIAGYSGGGTIRCRLSGDRLAQHDLYQRIYTDDGRGDGRITTQGLQTLNESQVLRAGNADWAVAPLFSALIASRSEMTHVSDELYDRLETEIGQPYWQRTNATVYDDVARLSQSSFDRIRFAPVLFDFWPALHSASAGERFTQQRDATLTALALELYHRRHGSWPAKLGELVPDLLPAVPPDRFTGGPLLYRVVDGRPLLYSAGPNGKDDGGKPIDATDSSISFDLVHRADKAPDGDWILWPPQLTAKTGE